MKDSSPPVRHEQWSSRVTFLLAAIGAAVGLGSIWKFPFTAGVGGGGAFVLAYLLAALFLALPALIAEMMVGRRGQASPPRAMRAVALEAGASAQWRWLGWLMIAAVFVTISFYSVIGGEVIAYIFKSAQGAFRGASPARINDIYSTFVSNPGTVIFWHSIFMLMNLAILSQGVRGGIERAVKILMPVLLCLLMCLAIYASVVGDFAQAADFLLKPDFTALTQGQILSAVGLAFFSIGVGMAIMMTYGSYLDQDAPLPQLAVSIAASVPVAAIVAGFCIFPIVFEYGLDPAEGPGLIFVTLPVAFSQMAFGSYLGALFFLLVLLAALTSSISALEPIVAWSHERFRMPRFAASALAALCAWMIGNVTALSFNHWRDFHPLSMIWLFEDSNPFEILDFLSSNFMLPLAVILISIFAGWVMPRAMQIDEIGEDLGFAYPLWRFLVCFVVPGAVSVILLLGFLGS